MLKGNKDRLILVNQYELNTTLRILKDDQKQFLLEKEKLQVLDDKIDEYIKEHYNRLFQGHLGIVKTIQLLR